MSEKTLIGFCTYICLPRKNVLLFQLMSCGAYLRRRRTPLLTIITHLFRTNISSKIKHRTESRKRVLLIESVVATDIIVENAFDSFINASALIYTTPETRTLWSCVGCSGRFSFVEDELIFHVARKKTS